MQGRVLLGMGSQNLSEKRSGDFHAKIQGDGSGGYFKHAEKKKEERQNARQSPEFSNFWPGLGSAGAQKRLNYLQGESTTLNLQRKIIKMESKRNCRSMGLERKSVSPGRTKKKQNLREE